MIETVALTKRFEGCLALDGVEVHVPDACIYGLVGPNGAGKTTIIRHMAGVMRPDEGKVLMNGAPVYENPAVKSRMMHIPDDLYFFPSANIHDMMRFYTGTYQQFDMQRYQALSEVFNLDKKRQLRFFSRGMQKQAALWLGLCCRPDVILLDEPVDGLDPVMRRTVWNLILEDVKQRHTTVFVSSHNLRELQDVCTHVGIMHKGRLLLERNLSEIATGIFKLQVAFEGDVPAEMDEFTVLSRTNSGRVYEYILQGDREEILPKVQALQPLLADILPLSLEEVFMHELKEMDYAEILA